MEKYKILIIEDDETAREQLAKFIRKEGFEVDVAQNGRAGLEIFRKKLSDIVITDLKMPDIDGMEVMHTINRLSPNVQTILVTAFGETDTIISAIHEGALDYIKKPVDLNQLTIALGRAKEKIYEFKKISRYPTLLLAEDEESTRNRLARIMEKEGWKVFTAADGKEAIKIFQQKKIDIVLLDIKMPQKNGLESLHEMRSITDDFEAIILTGFGDESNAIQALRDGAINFIRKPIDLDQMIIAVQRAQEKLNSDRILKYRTRELDLTKEIITKITAGKTIVVDVREYTEEQPAKNFARTLLDSMPINLIVIDKDMKVVYINQNFTKTINYKPDKVNEEFTDHLGKAGINGLSFELFAFTVNKVFNLPVGTVEIINISQYAYITLTSLTIIDKEGKKDVVLIAMRGERKQT